MSGRETEVPARREHDMNTNSAIAYVTATDIDSMVITGKQVAQIRDLFDLDVRTNYELQSLRNEVVRTLSDAASYARKMHDMDAFDRTHNAMSAITAVIDETLFQRGALY